MVFLTLSREVGRTGFVFLAYAIEFSLYVIGAIVCLLAIGSEGLPTKAAKDFAPNLGDEPHRQRAQRIKSVSRQSAQDRIEAWIWRQRLLASSYYLVVGQTVALLPIVWFDLWTWKNV
jgi:hypothetical protein